MKVLFVTNYFPQLHNQWGGAEVLCKTTGDNLLADGNEVYYLTTFPEKTTDKKEPNIYFIKTAEKFPLYFWKYGITFDFKTFISAYRLLTKIKPDIIHFFNCDRIFVPILISGKLLNIKMVSTIVDYFYFCPERIFYKKDDINCRYTIEKNICTECSGISKFYLYFRKIFYGLLLKGINKFLVLSENSRNILLKNGIKDNKINVINMPFNINIKNSGNYNINKKFDFIFIGWIYPHKGLKTVIDALLKLSETYPDIKLCVVMNSVKKDYYNHLIDIIKNAGREDNIIWIDNKLNKEDLYNLIRNSLAVLIPEKWPNMSPVVLFESILNKKAVIASKIGGIPEFIIDNQTGFLIEKNNVELWAERMKFFLDNPQKSIEFGELGYRLLKEKYMVNSANILYSIYKDIL